MTWTSAMTRAVLKAGIFAVMGTLATLCATWAACAASISEDSAIRLVDRGGMGLTALVVLAVVSPTVAATSWLVKRIVALFADQLKAQQAEREMMADAHRLERQEAAKLEREERRQAWNAVVAGAKATQELAIKHTATLEQLCANLENRPCIANGGVRSEET